jgi:hypothetical protein
MAGKMLDIFLDVSVQKSPMCGTLAPVFVDISRKHSSSRLGED